MAGRPVVEVAGAKQLRKTLRAAGSDFGDLKAANAEAARIAGDAGRGAAPSLSGALPGSVRSSGTKTAGIVRAGRASIPYAGPVHFGWPARNIPANPFLTDSAIATEPRWVPIYEARIEAILSDVKGL